MREVMAFLQVITESVGKQIPREPVWEDRQFGDKALVCPHCFEPVTNYYNRNAKPAYCQFCGQRIDWSDIK